METRIKEIFKKRLNSAIDMANCMNFTDYKIDKNNLKTEEDTFIQKTADYLHALNVYISQILGKYCPLYDTSLGIVKKSIMDTVTCVASATMCYGRGLSKEKYTKLLENLIADLDPEEVIE